MYYSNVLFMLLHFFSWLFCSAHSPSLLLKGSSKQCWKLFACEQGTEILMVCPKAVCYVGPSRRCLYPCLSSQVCWWKLLSNSDLNSGWYWCATQSGKVTNQVSHWKTHFKCMLSTAQCQIQIIISLWLSSSIICCC